MEIGHFLQWPEAVEEMLTKSALFLHPRENLDTEIARLKRRLLKCLEPIKVNNRPRMPKMMRLGERHNWEFNYRQAL